MHFVVYKFNSCLIKDKMKAQVSEGRREAFQADEARKGIQTKKYSICDNTEKWNSMTGFRKRQEVCWFRLVKWKDGSDGGGEAPFITIGQALEFQQEKKRKASWPNTMGILKALYK